MATFVETPIFTAGVLELLTDEQYAELQYFMLRNPEFGDVIQNTGGLRKIRWKVAGRGKSGGVRVIYFHVNAAAQFRMLLIYRKGVKDDLNAKEKAALRSIKARWG
jgi:hypothetical protein